MARMVYGIGVMFLLLGIACSAPQAPSQPSSGTDNNQPKRGGILNARVPTDFYDFDVSFTGKGTNSRAQGLAHSSLLAFETGPGVGYAEYKLKPGLAESWQVSPDGTTFTFNLRKGLKFANLPPVNGRELTSADVKWSYEYGSRSGALKDRKLPTGQFDWMFEGLQEIATPDPLTAVVRFKEPYSPFLNYSGHILNPIVAREIFEQDGHMKDRLVGAGPFQLDVAASQKGSRWVFKKNPDYWEAGKPYLDEVRWIVMPDDSTTAAAFLVGQVQLIGDFTYQPSQAIQKNNPKATTFDLGGATPVHMYMSMKFQPFQDIRIRKAIALALNRDELGEVQAGTKDHWAMAGTYPSMFTQEEIRKLMPHDPAQAKQLVIDAGYPNGLEVAFEYPTDNGQVYITDFQLIQSQLKKAGINMVAKPMSYAEYSATKKNHTATVTTTSKDWQADIDGYLFGTYYSKSKDNYDDINDPKLDQMLFAQRREPDQAKRTELIKQAVRYINTEAYLGRALYSKGTYMFGGPTLKGFAPNFQSAYNLSTAWLDN